MHRNVYMYVGIIYVCIYIYINILITSHFSLSGCSLTHRCCTELAKALASEKSSVREVDLSNNLIGDLGLKKLCAGLKSPHCTVAKLL